MVHRVKDAVALSKDAPVTLENRLDLDAFANGRTTINGIEAACTNMGEGPVLRSVVEFA